MKQHPIINALNWLAGISLLALGLGEWLHRRPVPVRVRAHRRSQQ